jgi:hypothetical protein
MWDDPIADVEVFSHHLYKSFPVSFPVILPYLDIPTIATSPELEGNRCYTVTPQGVCHGKIHPFSIGKPSISMGHVPYVYHGYMLNN